MALELTLLGTGSPVHAPHRTGPSQIISGGDANILVDCGWSATARLFQANVPPQRIDALFITHLHSDHTTDIADFLVMRWVGGTSSPMPIYGPQGTVRMIKGFQEAMAADTRYRLAHHGEKLWSGGLAADITEFEAGDDPVEIVTIGEITVKAFEVDHFPVKPAYGFRFEREGKAITISGDTNPCRGLVNGSRDADIMVCDSMNVAMMQGLEERLRAIGTDVQAALLQDAHDYHAPISCMAEVAQEAGVKHLVLSHVIPPITDELAPVFTAGLDAIYSGKITVGHDLEKFSV
jgi:ribonuclease Z